MVNWENSFHRWELVEYLDPDGKMMVKTDPTMVVGSERPQITSGFAKLLVEIANVYHRRIILLPDAGRSPFLQPMRAYSELQYWMTESEPELFNELLDNDEKEVGGRGRFLFDPNTIWGMGFEDWAEEFDPEGSQVHNLLIAGPLNQATANLIAGWDYLVPRGSVVAILPYVDLFGKDETGEYIREWCADRGLTYGVPVKQHLDGSNQKLVVVFGDKEHA